MTDRLKKKEEKKIFFFFFYFKLLAVYIKNLLKALFYLKKISYSKLRERDKNLFCRFRESEFEGCKCI